MPRTHERDDMTYENGKPKGNASHAKIRACLTCKRKFLSAHFGNRLCDPCRTLNFEMVETGNAGGRKKRK